MDADVFVPLVFFGFLAAIILVPIWLRERTKQSAHKLISQALDKGQPLDPQIMLELTQGVATKARNQQSQPRRSLGSGVVLLALAAAFAVLGAMNGWESWWTAPALILGAIGGAFLLLAIVDYTAKKRDM